MLRLILGGIALATVGYGVKKYIEDDIDRSIAFDEKMLELGQKAVEVVDNLEEKGCKSIEDENCPIKYIITVDALKEGWDNLL